MPKRSTSKIKNWRSLSKSTQNRLTNQAGGNKKRAQYIRRHPTSRLSPRYRSYAERTFGSREIFETARRYGVRPTVSEQYTYIPPEPRKRARFIPKQEIPIQEQEISRQDFKDKAPGPQYKTIEEVLLERIEDFDHTDKVGRMNIHEWAKFVNEQTGLNLRYTDEKLWYGKDSPFYYEFIAGETAA